MMNFGMRHGLKKSTPCNKVKFLCGAIYSHEEAYNNAKRILIKKFGNFDFESQRIDFHFTDYYTKEMGKPLFRRFISFKKLRNPQECVKIKTFCIAVERKLSREGRRTVNIDPGYLNEAKLVLFTTKDFSHRIYLGKGIYGEVTLSYRKGNFCDLPTTYPDYRTPAYKHILLSIRDLYRRQKNGTC
ncbi:MAG: DUF4416 family protein [Candidatus Omnitrophota bacterium]|nr:MAG: DUF4416 family protein [Candidatus Omnitrophota bacterium]